MNRRVAAGAFCVLLLAQGLLAACGAAWAAGVPDWVEAVRALPTPSWAGAADALVLEDSQDVTLLPSGRTLTRTRWAVRVLGPTGAGAAAISAEYLRGTGSVKSIEAWESDARGEFHHLGAKEAIDASAAGTWALYSEARVRSLRATDPLPGTVFAGETVAEDLPLFGEFHWRFDGLPSLHSGFSLTLPPGCEPAVRFGTGRAPRQVQEDRRWSWELTDVPARKPEPLSPRRGDEGAQVFVAVRANAAATAAPAGLTFSSWTEVAHWLYTLEAPQCVATPAIEAHALAIAPPGPDTLARLRALARDVQRTNYVAIDLGLARGWGYRPHPAEEVLAAGYGDCKDKANLLCALLRSAGREAWMVSAYAGDRDHVVRDRPTPSQFDHCIVAMRVPDGTALPAVFRHPGLGTLLAFDPTDPYTVFGELPGSEQGSLVLLDAPSGSDLVALPLAPPETNAYERTIRGALSDDGLLTAHVEERTRGTAGVEERRPRHEHDEAAYRAQLERWLAGEHSSVRLAEFRTREDSLAGTFRLDLDVTAPGFARTFGARMLSFRPAGLTARTHLTLPDSARSLPVELFAECFRESITVALPAGMRPEELPAAVDRATDFGRLHAEWSHADGELRFVRSVQTSAVTLAPERYAEVRAFYLLEARVVSTPVVLVRE